jgi:hypothetical protein
MLMNTIGIEVRKMDDLMLDLETLGTSPDTVVVQIGACYFSNKTGKIGKKFKVNVDIDSCLREGFTVEGNAIKWWLTEQAKNATFFNDTTNVRAAIYDFIEFSWKAERVWSHATFDFVIMMNYINRLGCTPGFGYKSARDIRTLLDLSHSKIKYSEDNTPRAGEHDALEDCIYQVGYCVKALNKLSGENRI